MCVYVIARVHSAHARTYERVWVGVCGFIFRARKHSDRDRISLGLLPCCSSTPGVSSREVDINCRRSVALSPSDPILIRHLVHGAVAT